MKTKIKLILILVPLALIDTIIPLPITALTLLYVVIERPPWFKVYVDEIYC